MTARKSTFDKSELWNLFSRPIPKQHLRKTNNDNITDIDSTYDWKLLTRYCGPFGREDTWGFDYDSTDMALREWKTPDGRARYLCTIKRVCCWLNFKGKRFKGTFPGGSENLEAGYAMKGAITSAFGKFLAYFGRGIEIYSGNRKGPHRLEDTPEESSANSEIDETEGGRTAGTSGVPGTVGNKKAQALHKALAAKCRQKMEAQIAQVLPEYGYARDERGCYHFSEIKKEDFERIKAKLLEIADGKTE